MLAAMAHACILLSAISLGVLGPAAAFFIWLLKREASAYVDEQALQAVTYQVLVAVALGAYWAITVALSFVVVGLCLIPPGLILSLLALAYGLSGAYQAYYGRPFGYLLVPEILEGLRATFARSA